MDNLIPVALVGGGIAYVLAKQSGPVVPPGDQMYRTPRSGSTMTDIINGVPYGYDPYDPYVDDSGQAAFNINGRLADPQARQKLDLLNLAMQKAYDGMSTAAKVSAADKINRELGTDLRGNEDWATVAQVAGGAIGAVGCNAVPGIGTAISPLCAMAGAYLGVQVEQWLSTNLDGLQDWVKQNVGNVIDTIGDKITSWFNDIF